MGDFRTRRTGGECMGATRLHVLDCGAMSCDLTWLLLKPGRSIRTKADRDKPVEWYPCTTHAVLVETSEGTMLWDTSCPRDWETRWEPTGLQNFFPYDHRRTTATASPAAGSRPSWRPGGRPRRARTVTRTRRRTPSGRRRCARYWRGSWPGRRTPSAPWRPARARTRDPA